MQIATLEELRSKADGNTVHLATLSPPESYLARRPVQITGALADADEKHLIPLLSEEFEAKAPALDLYSVGDALVLPNAATITSRYVVADSLRPYLHQNDIVEQFSKRLLPTDKDGEFDARISNLVRIRTPVLLLRDHGEAGYFHFLHSVLPRLLFWQELPLADIHIAVTTPFQQQFLEYLKIPRERMHVAAGQTYLCDQAYMITGLVRPDWSTGGFFERPLEVTRRLRRLIPGDAAHKGERIYISRRDSNIRAIANEPELEAKLAAKLGFKPVVLSELSVEQQIRTFASAAIMVGAHGAGLSNVTFMREGSAVCEIFPKSRIWPTFRAISTRAGLRYAAHVCPAADRYDIDDIIAAVERMLASS